MPSIAQQSVKGMVVMSKIPFEKRQQRRRHERHSQGYPWEKGETPPWATEQSAAHKLSGISRPPDGVWYGNSWHNRGGSDATRTKPGTRFTLQGESQMSRARRWHT